MELVNTIQTLTSRPDSVDASAGITIYPVNVKCLDVSVEEDLKRVRALFSGEVDLAEGVLPC